MTGFRLVGVLPVQEISGVGPKLIEPSEERVQERDVVAEECGLVFEVRGARLRQLECGPVAGPEFDDPLSLKDSALPMDDEREPGRVVAQPDRDAVVGEVFEPGTGVGIGLEDGAAIADDAHRHAGPVLVDDGLGDVPVIEIPGRHIETDLFGVDSLNYLRLGVVNGRKQNLFLSERQSRTESQKTGSQAADGQTSRRRASGAWTSECPIKGNVCHIYPEHRRSSEQTHSQTQADALPVLPCVQARVLLRRSRLAACG